MDDEEFASAGRASRRTRRMLLGVAVVAFVVACGAIALATGSGSQRSGALASALKVGDTVSVGTNYVTIDSGSVQGSIFVGSGRLWMGATAGSGSSEPVAVQFTDSGTWTLTAGTGAPGSVRFGDVGISRTALSGALSSNGGVVTSTLTSQMSGVATIVSSKFVLNSATIAYSPVCPVTVSTRLCASGAMFAQLSGSMSESFGSPVTTHPDMPFTAGVNLATGVANLEAAFDPGETAAIAAATLRNMKLRISAKDDSFAALPSDTNVTVANASANGGLNIQITGAGKLVMPKVPVVGWDAPDWNSDEIALTYVDGSLVLTGKILPGSVGNSSVTDFAYFDAQDTQATIYGNTLMVPRRTYVLGVESNSITFSALVGLPGIRGKEFDIPVGREGMFMMYTSNGDISLGWSVRDGVKLPRISDDFTFNFTPATISVTVNANPAQGARTKFSFRQNGNLSVSGKSGSVKDIAIAAEIAYEYTLGAISLAVSAVGLDGKAVWPNVASVKGLVLNGFAIKGTICTAGVPLGIGIAGNGAVSGSLSRTLNNSNVSGQTIPFTFVANLVVTSPCFEFSIGDPDGTANVIKLGRPSLPSFGGGSKYLVTATYAKMYAAPVGCTVGPYTVPSGFSVSFRGRVVGVATDIWLAVNTNEPMSANGSVSVGTVSYVGYSLKDATAEFAVGGYQLQKMEVEGTVSASDKVGDSVLGLKAEFGGRVRVDVYANKVAFHDVVVDAYYGAGGWHHISGNPSAYLDGNNLCYQRGVSGKTFKLCVV